MKKKLIGTLIANRIFFKKVRKSRHLYKKLDAWGIDGKLFKERLSKSYILIFIYEEEKGVLYTATSLVWKKHGSWLHFKPYDAQIFLPLSKFSVVSEEPKKRFLYLIDNGFPTREDFYHN